MSSQLSKILFPFRWKYRELGLSKWWWHRLAIVLFAIALSAVFLMSVWIVADGYSEKDSRLDNASSEYFDANQTDQNVTPTGSQALNHYEEQIKKINHDANVTLCWEIGFALGFLVCLSYMLQSLYRVILYVVYGSKRESESV
jgi:hypothetical protein